MINVIHTEDTVEFYYCSVSTSSFVFICIAFWSLVSFFSLNLSLPSDKLSLATPGHLENNEYKDVCEVVFSAPIQSFSALHWTPM